MIGLLIIIFISSMYFLYIGYVMGKQDSKESREKI